MLTAAKGKGRPSRKKGAALAEARGAVPETWLERPGCVMWQRYNGQQDSRSPTYASNLHRERRSQCFFLPSTMQGAEHVGDGRATRLWSSKEVSRQHRKASFIATGIMMKADGSVIGEGVAQQYPVEMWCHRLVFYLREGVVDWGKFVRDMGAKKEVQHVRHHGGCWAPWHIKLGSKAENQVAAQESKSKGKHWKPNS